MPTAKDFIGKCSGLKNVMGSVIADLPFGEWNLYELDHNCTKVIDKYGIFNIIEKVFDKESTTKPVISWFSIHAT